MWEKLNQMVDRAKEQATDSALRLRGKAKKLVEMPETRVTENILTKRTYYICARCRSEIGPVEENKIKESVEKLWRETKAAAGVISVNPIKSAGSGIETARIALEGTSDSAFTRIFKEDVIRDHRSKTLLIRCDYCGKYHCSSCWDPGKDRCKNCTGLGLRDFFS